MATTTATPASTTPPASAHDRRGRHRVERVSGYDRLRRGPRERGLPDEHFVRYARQAVLVAPAVDVRVSRRPLRAHVGRRPDDGARLRQVLSFTCRADGARDAEIRDDRAAA